MGTLRIVFSLIVLCFLDVTVHSQNDVEEIINKLSEANAFFANLFYKQLSKDTTNLTFSPLSISVALSALNVGVAGTTSQELNSTLGFEFADLNEQELLEGYQNLMTIMRTTPNGYQFHLANAQFLQSSLPVYSNYTASIADHFRASVRAVDFRNKNATLEEITNWVKAETNDKVTSILKDFTPADVMALVNAVFFKGLWLHKFDEDDTTAVDFFTADGTRKLVNMMSTFLSAKYNPRHTIGGAVLELPFKENVFSTFFLLPELGRTLTELEGNLTPEVLTQLDNDLRTTNLTVGVPKLSLQSEINLIPHLQAVGIRDVFTDSADFSRMSSSALTATHAVHKTTVEWTEDGVEATAATAITSSNTTGPLLYFWLNRPFMFIMRHNPTGVICFMGKVSDV